MGSGCHGADPHTALVGLKKELEEDIDSQMTEEEKNKFDDLVKKIEKVKSMYKQKLKKKDELFI